MALSKEKVAAIVKEFGKDEKDTGSTEVQIALLSAQIQALTAHLKANNKDQSSRRGYSFLLVKDVVYSIISIEKITKLILLWLQNLTYVSKKLGRHIMCLLFICGILIKKIYMILYL